MLGSARLGWARLGWARDRGERQACAGEAGFTLLEVLVAFVIAALALGALYEGAAGGLRTARIAGRMEEALSHARSHLAAVGASGLAPADQSGDDGGGFHWSTRVSELAASPLPSEAAGVQAPRLVLYDVAVRIDWDGDGGPRHVTLQTRRLGVARPPPP